jgi:hypothetical protein
VAKVNGKFANTDGISIVPGVNSMFALIWLHRKFFWWNLQAMMKMTFWREVVCCKAKQGICKASKETAPVTRLVSERICARVSGRLSLLPGTGFLACQRRKTGSGSFDPTKRSHGIHEKIRITGMEKQGELSSRELKLRNGNVQIQNNIFRRTQSSGNEKSDNRG